MELELDLELDLADLVVVVAVDAVAAGSLESFGSGVGKSVDDDDSSVVLPSRDCFVGRPLGGEGDREGRLVRALLVRALSVEEESGDKMY